MNATEQCGLAMLPSIAGVHCYGRTDGRTDVDVLTLRNQLKARNAHTRIQKLDGLGLMSDE
jgi:hypothetical protein